MSNHSSIVSTHTVEENCVLNMQQALVFILIIQLKDTIFSSTCNVE